LLTFLDWLADWQLVPVAAVLPILIFSERVPNAAVALALLAIPLLWWLHRIARGCFVTSTPADIPILILLATLPVGLWAAALPELAVPHLIKYVAAVGLYYSLVNTLAGREGGGGTGRKLKMAGWAALIGTLLLAVLILFGTAWGGGSKFLPASLRLRIPHLIGDFWYSKGFHPNIVAGVLAMLIPVTAAYTLNSRARTHRLLLGALFLAETFVLVLTQSRGALLGFGMALLVVAVGRGGRWAWAALILIIVVGVGVAIYGVQPALDLAMGGLGVSTARSAEGRLELLSRGLYMLQDFPFTGIGLGMFPRVLPVLYPLFLVGPDTEMPHVHDIYLQMGIDHGLPGLVAFLALIGLLWVMGVQAIRLSRGRPWEPLAIGLLAGLAAYMVHGLVETVGSSARAHFMIWGHFGLLTAVWRWTETDRIQDGDSTTRRPSNA